MQASRAELVPNTYLIPELGLQTGEFLRVPGQVIELDQPGSVKDPVSKHRHVYTRTHRGYCKKTIPASSE